MNKTKPDRKVMPWSKVPTGVIEDPVWLSLTKETRLNYFLLFLFATRLDYGGGFFQNGKGLSIDQISIKLHLPADETLATFKELEKENYALNNSNGWELVNFPYEINYYQKVCKEAANRMKKSRKENKAKNSANVTANVTDNVQKTSVERSVLKNKNKNKNKNKILTVESSSSSSVHAAEADDELVRIFKAFGARSEQLKYLRKTSGIIPSDIWAMAAQVRNDDHIRKPNYIALQNILLGERASAEWYDESCWSSIPEKIRQAGGLSIQGAGKVSKQVGFSGYTHFNKEPDETVEQTLGKDRMTVQQAWQSAVGQLHTEMPKGAFDNYMRDAVLLHWADGLVQVGVRNSYAKDWLESRLTSTINRLLTGICNRDIRVEFITE